MRPKGKRHNTIPVSLGGMFSAGDPSDLPDGLVRSLRNYVVRPDPAGARYDCRAPFVYDSLDSVRGFAIWQDLVNELTKTQACNSADNKLYPKNASGTGYGAGVAGLTASTRLTSYTNFLGKLYMMFDNGAGVPTAAACWDGTTIVTAPFNSPITSRIVQAFNDRLILVDCRVTITDLTQPATGGFAYDWTNVGFTRTNVNAANITSGGAVLCRIFPTSTASNACSVVATTWTYSATQSDVVWRADFRGVDSFNSVPFTMELYVATTPLINHVYALGNIMASGGYRYICTTAGTSAGAPPAYTTTLGGTTVDGTATWTNTGTDTFASLEDTVPNATTQQAWSSFSLHGTIPLYVGSSILIGQRLKLYNTATPSISTLVPLDVSYKDGLTDGDPRKQNYGHQLTAGDFNFPFINQDSSYTATVNIDGAFWSEIDQPKRFIAKNTFPLQEIAGLGTASCICSGRLVLFKRRGMWIFKGIADSNEPILPETPAIQVGCIGPLAVDVSRDNEMFWISEQHVCRMRIGDPFPTFIDTPGMYEEIMDRTAASWVESQATYNMPLLTIDHQNRDIWIYTQKGKIYIWNMDTKLWGYFDTNPTGTAAEVACMVFDPASNRMLVSFGGQGATRYDETSNAADTIVAGGGTTWNIQSDIIPRPFELFAPRYEASLLEVGLFHLATIQQGSLTLQYSYDRGATYTTPSGYPITTYLTNPRIRLPIAATGESVTIKLSRTGAGGKRNWSISKCDALLRVHRGELPKVNST